MKIKYIAWKKVICSDVNRLIYCTQGEGLHNKGDQAIQNFNTLNENPGLWSGFTGGVRIPRKKEVEAQNRQNGTHHPTTYDVLLSNSVNPLRLWEDKNEARKNPVKINHEIWDRNENHDRVIIETWYLGYMRILRNLLKKLVARDGTKSEATKLLSFVENRLSLEVEIRANILKWIFDTQDGFGQLYLDTSFMKNNNIKDINGFVEKNFYVVVKCEEDGKEMNMALMANSQSSSLHPTIKALLMSNEKGGENVDIDVSVAASSPDSQRFLDALYSYKNIILYGPPGTGKTHMLTELMESFNANVLFDDLDTEAPFRVTGHNNSSSVKWCTFHPNYSYESFVHGIKPKVVDGKLAFEPYAGPMLKQSLSANKGEKALLVIDEINRAKADDVFGAAMAILDRGSNETIVFPHAFEVNGEKINDLKGSDNLFIVGTMNSLDKSTSPLSSELKRRFVIVEIAPNVEVLRCHLQRNNSVNSDLSTFCCDLMRVINERIHMYCGKEFELGQGYFWGLVEAEDNHFEVMADIITNKIMPHLQDTLPLDCLSDFFTPDNLDVLYEANDYGFDFLDVSQMPGSNIINAFATTIGSSYRCYSDEQPVESEYTFEEYEKEKIQVITDKLLRYKNIILTGCSGTGKSYITNQIAKNPTFTQSSKMFWHGSTEYADVIEGISATVKDGDVDYAVLPGMVRQLAESSITGSKLMIIEGINKSNAAENLGELITLLEPDKRYLSIEGYDGQIRIPEDMYFICTMNPTIENQYKFDSAMKRRFVIINMHPDYDLLALHLGLNSYEEQLVLDNIYDFDSKTLCSLAIQLLTSINTSISSCIGNDFKIGHSVFWNLRTDCNLTDILKVVDLVIIPQIEEYCYDEDIAKRIFGEDSPVISIYPHGVEINSFSSLSPKKIIMAMKGLLGDE
ncbi:hypothetical protein FDA95_12435 [Clostridium botulinum]|uniref:AAA family ATPase n=1 Tax=Clostridium tetani TaxID=1513 RepID=UPI0010099C61|nr:AAA family ATPase [Clostridium tetani]NFK79389.1 hypothetical protein [Clostridium botulinum]RXI64429.1 hypothetical protein DP132_01030 [Clostridium tetani]RXI68020.1 hypothetical protein DP121_11445 [Clostridium tetani]RXM54363.1 hypothetical protein DP134_11930 [Clostridium tetani]